MFVIYGAGETGIQAMYEIGKEKIEFFIDRNAFSSIDGIPVYSIDDCKDRLRSDICVVLTSYKYRDEMIETLNQMGFSNYIFYSLGSMNTGRIDRRLNASEWGHLYNKKLKADLLSKLHGEKEYSIWTKELLNITKEGEKILEIGCGSGESSLALAKNGRNVTAVDYSLNSIDLVRDIKDEIGIDMELICADATKELPLNYNEYTIFQVGLLEHFDKDERIALLKNWKQHCKRMISLIPNANSVSYRLGKSIMENSEGERMWKWGKELPQATMLAEFYNAGYRNINEYTIGADHALRFLPREHYIRKAFEELIREGYELNQWGQGYLLVTIGVNEVDG